VGSQAQPEQIARLAKRRAKKRIPELGIAVAHNLLRLAFQVLSTGREYKDKSAAALEPRQRERMIRHHIRRLGKLGASIGQRRATAVRPSRRTAGLTSSPPRRQYLILGSGGEAGIFETNPKRTQTGPAASQLAHSPCPRVSPSPRLPPPHPI